MKPEKYTAALDTAEFYEGSEKVLVEGGEPCVVVNAEDFAAILAGLRAYDSAPAVALPSVDEAMDALCPDEEDTEDIVSKVLALVEKKLSEGVCATESGSLPGATACAPSTHTERVVSQLRERAAVGLRKYGVGTDRSDLSALDWLQHLQEELMDAAVYVERLKEEHTDPSGPDASGTTQQRVEPPSAAEIRGQPGQPGGGSTQDKEADDEAR